MKKILSILLTVALVFSLVGCASSSGAVSTDDSVSMNAELSHPSASEEEVNEARAKQEQRSVAESKISYFDDINTLILAIKNSKINLAYLGEAVARYAMSRDNTLGYVLTEYSLPNEYALCMREEDIDTINNINTAIIDMKSDGTLQKLEEEHIEKVINGAEPQSISLPKVEGRRNITVAITGDIPPMDYISANGEAAGFNVAFLKELSDRCDLNIELSTINSQARAQALMSGKVDCLFWTVIEQSPDARMKYKDVPKDAIISDPYFSNKGVNLYSKENKKTMNYIEKRMKAIVEVH